MDPEVVLGLGRDTIQTTLLLMGPPLGMALVIGLAISVLQAATQIQEMTLTFIPKVVAVFGILLVLGPWIANVMLAFAARLFGGFPELVR